MDKIIKALPNQSLLDMILMEYGTLEAGMLFASANNVSISKFPATGTAYNALKLNNDITDTNAVKYLVQNEIQIGTRGNIPSLACAVILKPVMEVVPNISDEPHVIGYYSFDFAATSDFVNTNDLVADYLTTNKVFYETEERYVTSIAPDTATQLSATPMADKSIPYKLNWIAGLGYMMVWSDFSFPVKTVTFKDVAGNEVFVQPIAILDNVSQGVIDYLIADISVETVSATSDAVTLRLIRTHRHISLGDFSDHTMAWLGMAATSGSPDPDDPGNPDKKILVLEAGTYTIGVKTTYQQPGIITYPPSAFTMCIEVQ